MTALNFISKVAIVGAGGNCGRFITEELLKTGKHTITAITRADSPSTFPNGVVAKIVDYSKPETLVDALKGQDALVITISGRAPIQETEEKLVRAAAEAGVPWILPNEWSPDSDHEGLRKDVFLFEWKATTRKLIEDLERSSYIGLVTGFWYDYSLSIARNYGFDFTKRTVTFIDDGETKICTSTWPQIGRAVAALLSLPIQPGNSNQVSCLQNLRNKLVYINSFTVSQKDMLASVLRVTETKEADWTISRTPHQEQFKSNFLYGRVFFPDGSGNFEQSKGTSNHMLGLPHEDIDQFTKIAIEKQKNAGGP